MNNIEYDEFGREVRLRQVASAAVATRRERSPPRQRRNRSRSPDARDHDEYEYEYKRELNRYKDAHLDGEAAPVNKKVDNHNNNSNNNNNNNSNNNSNKTSAAPTIAVPADLPEEDVMKLLGLPVGFDSTHDKHVVGADASAARVVKKRVARQYMNIVRRSKPGQQQPPQNIRIKR